MPAPLLEIKDLKKRYPVYGSLGKLLPPKTHVNAVSGVSLHLNEGETYGLVGESGCGKTTTGRAILGLTRANGGQILYRGRDLTKLTDKEFRPLRRDLQMVFQDPLSSLNPRQRIGPILEEAMVVQGLGSAAGRRRQAMETLEKVGLSEEHYFRYPHELSGGQVQRLGIARALIIRPKLVVCDEPVSALDVSVQAQILNMLIALRKEMHLSLIFISHDIGVVRYISNRVGVMYLGTLVEEAETELLFAAPQHPYTRALLAAVPDFGPRKEKPFLMRDERPIRTDMFRGCAFHTRCPYVMDRCREQAPVPLQVGPGHRVACHLVCGVKDTPQPHTAQDTPE